MDEAKAREIVEAWLDSEAWLAFRRVGTPTSLTKDSEITHRLITAIAAEPCQECAEWNERTVAALKLAETKSADLDCARTEATAEAYARCRQLAASIRLPVVVDDEGKGWQRGVEAVVRKISTANPDPDYRSRIRGEVLESVVRLCIAHAKVVDTDAERNLANLIASEVHALKETIPNENTSVLHHRS